MNNNIEKCVISAKKIEISDFKKEDYNNLDNFNVVSKEQVEHFLVNAISKMIKCRLGV